MNTEHDALSEEALKKSREQKPVYKNCKRFRVLKIKKQVKKRQRKRYGKIVDDKTQKMFVRRN